MKGLIFAICLGLAVAPAAAYAADASGGQDASSAGSGTYAGDTQASSSSLSPVQWGLISAGVVGTVAGLAVALNSGGHGHGHGGTTTTTATTTSN